MVVFDNIGRVTCIFTKLCSIFYLWPVALLA